MISFMLIVSFLLHIILLATTYYLFQQIQSLKQAHTKEITDLFEMYLQEIKAENSRLEDEVLLQSPQHKQETIIESTPTQLIKQADKSKVAVENEYTPQTNMINDHYEASLESQILQLYHQGTSAAEIAQKLNCGKTEAALVIKIYERKKS